MTRLDTTMSIHTRSAWILECGDLSPLFLLWRLVAKAGPRSAARGMQSEDSCELDGDKSPAESADKSAHSKDWPPGFILVEHWLGEWPALCHSSFDIQN